MFIIPNALYNYYGETRSIENLYPTMLRYLDYLKAKEKDGGYLPRFRRLGVLEVYDQ